MAKATNVYEAAAVCEPDLALESNHEWYVDLSPHRGENVVRQLFRAIKAKDEAASKGLIPDELRFAKLLLTGLRGSGKTTEMNQLQGVLIDNGYFPVPLSGVRELNLEQLTHIELLMSLLWALQDAEPAGGFRLDVPGRADDELNLSLASILVEETEKQRADVKLQSQLGVGADIPFFVKVKMALKSALAASTETSRLVKARVFQRASAFITTLNTVLDEVQAGLRGQGCKGLVSLVDELDRVPMRKADDYTDFTLPELLFDLQSSDLKAPRAHMVYTFPSQLRVKVNLGKSWSDRPWSIPAVKLLDRAGGTRYEPGYRALSKLIEARVDVPSVFSPAKGLEKLVQFSGGYARDLLRLVRYAANQTDTQIGPTEIDKAGKDLIGEYDLLLDPALLPLLVEVERTKRLPPDPRYAVLLERNLVLTYWNDEEWADLHPAVKEAPGYRGYSPPGAH
jgi:energy-coupling factor transporter ATP-binding protein EcfA2